MPVHHICPLCDFTRVAVHTTVLDPDCPSCGAVLTSGGAAAVEAPVLSVTRVAQARWFERTVLVLVIAPLLAACGKLGWAAAGAGGALGALLLAGLVCFVALAPSTRAG